MKEDISTIKISNKLNKEEGKKLKQQDCKCKTRKYEINQYEFKTFKKIMGLWMIYIGGNFNWLKDV